MNKEELSLMLSGQEAPLAICRWLRTSYLPTVAALFNSDGVRKRLGLYQGEKIPENERNLTDVRNRISLIIEYELARLSNSLLEAAGEADVFWSYVVANRFPDLEVHKADGSRGLRIEVKCLQSIAEEKSANFDTLRKDIDPDTDFVVVFVWEWAYGDSTAVAWDRAPKLLRHYVFHAASLAILRDTYWLNRPPSEEALGDGLQGFDLRYAVNCAKGIYAEEEGNYGKLLRIWQRDFPYRPIMSDVLADTEEEYLAFKEGVVLEGFWSLSDFFLPRLAQGQLAKRFTANGIPGARAAEFAMLLAPAHASTLRELALSEGLRYVVAMTDKYVCTGYELVGGQIERRFQGLKPKLLSRDRFGLD